MAESLPAAGHASSQCRTTAPCGYIVFARAHLSSCVSGESSTGSATTHCCDGVVSHEPLPSA